MSMRNSLRTQYTLHIGWSLSYYTTHQRLIFMFLFFVFSCTTGNPSPPAQRTFTWVQTRVKREKAVGLNGYVPSLGTSTWYLLALNLSTWLQCYILKLENSSYFDEHKFFRAINSETVSIVVFHWWSVWLTKKMDY